MSAPVVSLLPPLTGSLLPPPSPMGLSDTEQALVRGLSTKLAYQSVLVINDWLYYDGLQRLANLGVSIPQQMSGVRTVVDWPRICIDPLVHRANLDGFRFPNETEVDSELADICRVNDFAAEAPLAFLDSLVTGRGYMIVGSPDQPGDAPIISVESPLNLALTWDPRTRRTTAAYQSYEVEGAYLSLLYLPDETIYMSRDEYGTWNVDHRDQHKMGEVSVVRLPNRSRTSDREGRSSITPAVKNTTDSAVRSLLGMEIAREFYSVPHRYVLGVKESDLIGADGVQKTALEMTMNKFLALERDSKGQLPQVGQFQAFDPSVFTKIIDEHAQLMASYTGFPPAYFGQTTTANPASADAIRAAENGLVRAAEQAQRQFSGPLQKVMQLAWRFANGGAPVPAEMRALETDWLPASTPTPAATTDAVAKQIAEGSIPATSDVTLRTLGYSSVDRARLAQDRAADPAQAIINALASSIVTKLARADNAVAKDLEAGGVITSAVADAAVAAHDAQQAAAIAAATPQP